MSICLTVVTIVDIKYYLGSRDLDSDKGPGLRAKSESGEGQCPRWVAHCEVHSYGLRPIDKREVEVLRDREEWSLYFWTIETKGVDKHGKGEAIWTGELGDLLGGEVLLPQFQVAVDSEDGLRKGSAIAHWLCLTRHVELEVSTFDARSVVKGVWIFPVSIKSEVNQYILVWGDRCRSNFSLGQLFTV